MTIFNLSSRGAILLAFAFIVSPAAPLLAQTNLPAFPGAMGFGAAASGGRGGSVYHVRNLDDSGPGSFRDAVSQPNRIVVFDVGGYAAPATTNTANNTLLQVASNITIAGQTAPGQGFGVMGRELSFGGSTNVICRYIRCQQGTYDANIGAPSLQVGSAAQMVFDHVSVEFGSWDNIDGVNGTNLTFQYCLNADPIYNQFGAHMEIGPVCWYRNLWANCNNRQPLARTDTVYVNNLVYNYGGAYTAAGWTASGSLSNFLHDIVNNYFVRGPTTTDYRAYFFQISYQSIYTNGNMVDSSLDGTLDGGPTVITDSTVTNLGAPWSAVTTNLPTISATATVADVISTAGCSQQRDPVDVQVLADCISLGTQGHLWTNQVQTGLSNNGYGTLTGAMVAVDSDQDGMPDYWELANGLNPNNPSDANSTGASGYTHLEEYLNWLAGPHAVVSQWTTTTNTASVDLWPFTLGFTNLSPTYEVFNPTHGTVTLLPDGHTAGFTPNSNYLGMASFGFQVTSSSNIAMTNTVNVLVTPASVPTNILWVGDGLSNRWDNLTATNWFNGNTATVFTPGNGVIFDDTGSTNPAINLIGVLTPALVSFTASNNYALTSSAGGLLSGPMLLSKDGAGTLTIGNSNNFTGGVELFGGTLALNNAAAVGTNAIVLNVGSLTLGAAAISNDLVLVGTTLFNPSPYTFNGAISGNGTLLFSNTAVTTLAGTMTNFTGTLSLTNNTGTLLFNGNLGSTTATFDLGIGSAKLQTVNGSVTVQLGALQGGANTILSGAAAANAPTTYVIGGNNNSTTFTGTISDGAGKTAVVKTGTGTLTLTGINTYSGNTLISNGTLQLLPAGGLAPNPPGGSLLARYSFDNTLADVSGNGNNGSLSGGAPAYGAGYFNQAIDFFGAQAVTAPFAASLSGCNSYTLSGWINLNAIPGNGVAYGIFGTRGGSNPGDTVDIKVLGTGSGHCNLHADIGTGSAWLTTAADYPANFAAGTWYLVTYVVDAAAQLVSIYVNGTLATSLALSGTPLFMQTGQYLNIGNDYYQSAEFMNGAIDEVCIYGRALSAVEVAQLYSGTPLVNFTPASGTGSGTVVVNRGGTLTGTGTVGGAVTVSAGGVLAPGNPFGGLTISNNLTLAPGSITAMQIQSSPLTNDDATIDGTLVEGGTLNITNAGRSAFVAGERFKLFNAAAYSGAFSNCLLPALPAGLVWKTDALNTSGVLSVVVPAVITGVSSSGGDLTLACRGGTNASFYLLTSTNLAAPLANWSCVLTNQFDANGNSRLTNAINPNLRQSFYLLQAP